MASTKEVALPGHHLSHGLFAGTCSIRSIEEHQRELLRAMREDGLTAVDLSEVESVDVSFVQLMVSASKWAGSQGRPFALKNVPATVAAPFQKAGVNVANLSSPEPMIEG